MACVRIPNPKNCTMRSFRKLFLLILFSPLALCAKAGIPGLNGKLEGILNGYVTDAVTKKPIQGVTVLAIFPGTNNAKEAKTDADGYFHFMSLPASQVTVQFNKEGYQSCKRQCITITEKTSVRLNVECYPEELNTDINAEYPLLRLLQSS